MKPEIDSAELDLIYLRLSQAFADAFCFPTVEHDFAKRARFVAAAEDQSWLYRDAPTYDPAYNTLRDNGFWLNVRRHGSRTADGEREMVAHCAIRVWRNTRLNDLFVNNRFIQERDSGFSIAFASTETAHVAGTLAYIGGAWVHPDFRHRRIAALLMAFSQLHLLHHYDCDYALGLVDDKAAQAGMGARAWRFHHHHSGVTWNWPGRGRIPAWLIYNTRSDMIAELRRFAVRTEPAKQPAMLQATA
ncbi:MAG TPA: hypothetical protein VMU42_03880 [Candidatus Sulfotelmatobacter sp.]|nr:hypothetical protein [Candidatus Sulfotelmatobacter sp.]